MVDILKRKHLRLRRYDYSSAGAYFVTICVRNRKCLLGQIKNREVVLSNIGQIVCATWDLLPTKFPNIQLDQFVIMPNHIHSIVFIHSETLISNVGAPFMAPNTGKTGAINRAPTLGEIVRTFKASCTYQIHYSGIKNFAWQRNYYERVIRNEQELFEVRKYIQENPFNWDTDPENIGRLEPQEA